MSALSFLSRYKYYLLFFSLFFLPLFLPSYHMFLLNLMLVHVIVALGLNLLLGYTGQVSLGHSGFVAIGAYGCLLLFTHGFPFAIALLCGGLLAAAAGWLLGLPALRLKGPYLAIATLGFGMAVTQIIARWPLFGGHNGLTMPNTFLQKDAHHYLLILSITGFLTWTANNLTQSKTGRAFLAIKESHIAAAALGVNIAHYKTLSFAISAFYAGIAGGLWAMILGYLNPSMFSFYLSVLFLTMVILGGIGSHQGAILGAIIVTLMEHKLQRIGELPLIGDLIHQISNQWLSLSGMGNISFIAFGLALMLVMLFEPKGIQGLLQRTKETLASRNTDALP